MKKILSLLLAMATTLSSSSLRRQPRSGSPLWQRSCG